MFEIDQLTKSQQVSRLPAVPQDCTSCVKGRWKTYTCSVRPFVQDSSCKFQMSKSRGPPYSVVGGGSYLQPITELAIASKNINYERERYKYIQTRLKLVKTGFDRMIRIEECLFVVCHHGRWECWGGLQYLLHGPECLAARESITL